MPLFKRYHVDDTLTNIAGLAAVAQHFSLLCQLGDFLEMY